MLVDSMPFAVCKCSRANQSKVRQEVKENTPNYAFCVVQNFYYFAYKLHTICTPDGIIKPGA